MPNDVYFQFVRIAHQYNIPVLVDTQKAFRAVPQSPAISCKINREELGVAFEQPIDSEKTFFELIQRIHLEGVEWVLITHARRRRLHHIMANTGLFFLPA